MFQVKEEIYWVGIKDWELRTFHGEEYSTHRGSSYNSYLIKDDKVALVDTVWEPFKKDFVSKLAKEVGLENIDYIIINHSEIDHSGALEELMQQIPNVPIYCSAKGKQMLYSQFHQEWNFKVVKTGDTLVLGKNELVFIEAPMLHWPDSMFTYVKGANVLLSNDAFGQHYAASGYFNDEVDQCELFQEAMKYYANILTPFSRLVPRKIQELQDLNVPIDMIAPSHGVIWRDNPMQIVEKYLEWSQSYDEGSVVIVYDTMWKNTKKMAHAIAKGLEQAGLEYKIFNAAKTDKNDIIVEVFKAKCVLVGSSTINNGILTSIAALMEEIKGMKFANKIGASFGSYGWSGESPKQITELLKEARFSVPVDGLGLEFTPVDEDITKCIEFGKQFASLLS